MPYSALLAFGDLIPKDSVRAEDQELSNSCATSVSRSSIGVVLQL